LVREEQILKTSDPKVAVDPREGANDWRDLSRQLEKIFAEKALQGSFGDELRILGIIKELAKEQINYENTGNATRTLR